MPLTDTEIRRAKIMDKPYKLFDSRGLFLIVTPTGDTIPDGYPPEGIEFLIVKPDLAAAKTDFIPFVMNAIRVGMPLFLAVRGPASQKSSRTFLNTHLATAATARDATTFHSIFGKLLEQLKAGPFGPVVFRARG